MNLGLPVVVDIAISLIFVYFTLSLLSSEIQELLKTLLQWRAVHLKKSIEGLLVGNDPEQLQEARELANKIYDNPLLRSLNHKSKEGIASYIRKPLDGASKILKGDESKRVFGKQPSGPSYIPAKVFSTSLLNTFDFVSIYRKLLVYRLQTAIKAMVPNPEDYEQRLKNDIDLILTAFETKKISLDTAIQELAAEAEKDQDIFNPELYQKSFGSPESIARFGNKMQISLADTIKVVRKYLTLKPESLEKIYPGLGENPSFEDAKTYLEKLRKENSNIDEMLPTSADQTFLILSLILTNPEIRTLIDALPPIPPALGANLENFAEQALTKIDNLSLEANQFEQEISTWFDQSMARAKGVYNRNAKLVTMIIAFTITIAANADTFYMLDQFAKEEAVSASVIQVINKLPLETLEQPEQISDTINELTATTSLPIGWQPDTITKQQYSTFFLFKHLPFFLQRIPGWIVTGFAISMGAAFWYELLKKFVNIKNVGKKPEETDNIVISQ